MPALSNLAVELHSMIFSDEVEVIRESSGYDVRYFSHKELMYDGVIGVTRCMSDKHVFVYFICYYNSYLIVFGEDNPRPGTLGARRQFCYADPGFLDDVRELVVSLLGDD